MLYNDFVNRTCSCALATILLVTLPGAGYQAESEEEKESYAIYSILLRLKEPGVSSWAIVQQTVHFNLCLRPTPDQESIYRSMLDDYVEKNKNKLVLEPKFDLPKYAFVERSEWTRSSHERSFAAFSAVGFNSARTRAAVCFWAGHSGTCNVLIKKDGVWQIDRDWRRLCVGSLSGSTLRITG